MIESLLKRKMIPDFMIRAEIRKRLAKKLREEYRLSPERRKDRLEQWIREMKTGPIALNTREANEQHYELPASFFGYVLSRHMKYSSGYWDEGVRHLEEADDRMLALTCERAQAADGQDILELGCGWGSLTLYMAKKYPNARITGVSNSKSQRDYILYTAEKRRLSNINIITADMNDFSTAEKFDRVMSVEMFEHMRNYAALLEKIAGLLKPDGKLFVHVFAHRELSYPYIAQDPNDWIAKYFFTGGLMPCARIFDYFPEHFRVAAQWDVPGTHYQRTCRAWLDRMDFAEKEVKIVFKEVYGFRHFRKWWAYWRIFFMSCEELFGCAQGKEWFVSHTLMEKR